MLNRIYYIKILNIEIFNIKNQRKEYGIFLSSVKDKQKTIIIIIVMMRMSNNIIIHKKQIKIRRIKCI